jgi:3'-phosphoadenosine 5'-phosphosulfate sulfotransferase (PAPS reductase)/FAD synthetase
VSVIAFVSCGNDSIALLQYLHERGESIHAAYSDTEWGADFWDKRVGRVEAWCTERGFSFSRIPSPGMEAIIRRKKAWPRNGMQFCTQLLKIEPAKEWLDTVDPKQLATCAVGIRREESAARRSWPEWTESSANHGGRSLWAPLVRMATAERDALIQRAGFDVLPFRSMECFPCVNASRADLMLLDEKRLAHIEHLEQDLGVTSNGKPRTMFRPNKFMGAVGIREIFRWAKSARGAFTPSTGGCDSGMCGG